MTCIRIYADTYREIYIYISVFRVLRYFTNYFWKTELISVKLVPRGTSSCTQRELYYSAIFRRPILRERDLLAAPTPHNFIRNQTIIIARFNSRVLSLSLSLDISICLLYPRTRVSSTPEESFYLISISFTSIHYADVYSCTISCIHTYTCI